MQALEQTPEFQPRNPNPGIQGARFQKPGLQVQEIKPGTPNPAFQIHECEHRKPNLNKTQLGIQTQECNPRKPNPESIQPRNANPEVQVQ